LSGESDIISDIGNSARHANTVQLAGLGRGWSSLRLGEQPSSAGAVGADFTSGSALTVSSHMFGYSISMIPLFTATTMASVRAFTSNFDKILVT